MKKRSTAALLNPLIEQVSLSVDIYIKDPEDLKEGKQQISSLGHYADGDYVSCTGPSALENCRQIRGYFPAGTPQDAYDQVDELYRAIDKLENGSAFSLQRILSHPLFVAAVVIALAVFSLARCQPQ